MQPFVTHPPLGAAEDFSIWSWLKSRLLPARRKAADHTQWLAKSRIARMTLDACSHLKCETGVIWVTSDDGGPDIVLEAGQSIYLPQRTGVLIEALQKSRITLRS